MKQFWRKVALIVVPFIGQLFIRLLFLTLRKRYHYPKQFPEEPLIVAFWHGELLLQMYNYYKIRSQPNIGVMISEHFDGELIAKTSYFFKLNVIRGSSRRGGAKALMSAIKLMRQGQDIAITPDGPKGPRHSISNGVIALAQKQDASIVVQNVKPQNYWQFKSWDKFVVPKPFSIVDMVIGEPFKITGLSEEQARTLIHNKMMEYAIQ
jgi:lysophospholipid acyltransferase (LPLAT)-like uncharacterized protein